MNPMNNYLGVKRTEWNTPIYRFTSANRILSFIDKRKNTLVSPRKWKDPFENILSRMKFKKRSMVTSLNIHSVTEYIVNVGQQLKKLMLLGECIFQMGTVSV